MPHKIEQINPLNGDESSCELPSSNKTIGSKKKTNDPVKTLVTSPERIKTSVLVTRDDPYTSHSHTGGNWPIFGRACNNFTKGGRRSFSYRFAGLHILRIASTELYFQFGRSFVIVMANNSTDRCLRRLDTNSPVTAFIAYAVRSYKWNVLIQPFVYHTNHNHCCLFNLKLVAVYISLWENLPC